MTIISKVFENRAGRVSNDDQQTQCLTMINKQSVLTMINKVSEKYRVECLVTIFFHWGVFFLYTHRMVQDPMSSSTERTAPSVATIPSPTLFIT